MTDIDQNRDLQTLFTEVAQELPGEAFTDEVMTGTDRIRRRLILRRICLGLALGLVAIPLQDVALALTPILIQSLFDVDNHLIAQLLAPVNSVGGLLSAALLSLRAAHKRLLSV